MRQLTANFGYQLLTLALAALVMYGVRSLIEDEVNRRLKVRKLALRDTLITLESRYDQAPANAAQRARDR